MAMPDQEGDVDYLQRVERLAHAVVDHAQDEPWFAYGEDGQAAERSLERAINDLASHLRHTHHDGDGCLSE
ncbi:hypothetical protein J4G33_15385 [Actinotalea sp. BY-33]|uniref:Uncharacterized protein n=1 Tax=Actinotalea soli TaxID=2819234 RepID=A0A939RUZ2_9CELL|nr:hypothetical protein [Actinotalea soli]MBO1753189.1 hypothetical protein [Actinotalea soli]